MKKPANTRPRADGPGRVGWSCRITTGTQPQALVGLALSGGGIRSATFALGILQHLQKLDLLRKVDYLSTVSGGGFIGSWLVANVLRNRYWLTQPTDWAPSVGHLRRYSNYLSPTTGLFSADTWSMWGSWLRNMLLIQLTAVACLGLAMLAAVLCALAFDWAPPSALHFRVFGSEVWMVPPVVLGAPVSYPVGLGAVLIVMMAGLTAGLLANIHREQPSNPDSLIQFQIVIPALVASFLAAAALWGTPRPADIDYGALLQHEAGAWMPALTALFAAFFVLAWRSVEDLRWPWSIGLSLLAAAVALTGSYLVLCAARWAFWQWQAQNGRAAFWHAFTFGPSLVLLAPTVGVLLMIGVLGRNSSDWRREWWTRLGAWLGIYAIGPLALAAVTVYGPWLVLTLVEKAHEVPFKTAAGILAWVGTLIGGVAAGNNTRSDSETARDSTAWAISLFARFAAVVFMASTLCLVATLTHVILYNVSAEGNIAGGGVYWTHLAQLQPRFVLAIFVGASVLALITSWRFDVNVFGLNQFYRNRLVRCYLGATRWQPGKRTPHKFTTFDKDDDLALSTLTHALAAQSPYRGPFPILNGTLNLGGSADLSLHTRHGTSFTMTPLRCGAARAAVGYAPTRVTLGEAASISGAAASPNMGYDTSPLVSFLLTMFNVRLGWWFPNPGRKRRRWSVIPEGSERLALEATGGADERSRFVNVSDGGHFENLGIYELVRRRCSVIIASDGECDDDMAFGSLGRVIRMCRTDFKADIDIDVESLRRVKDTRLSRAHCAVGQITYANGGRGYLIYLKASLTGDEDVDVQQYHASHPTFPHESTADQFFAEDQFESYRKLGEHVAGVAFRGGTTNGESVVDMARRLKDTWVPDSVSGREFVASTEALAVLWERMRATPGLGYLYRELHGLPADPTTPPRSPNDEGIVCLELLQLLENTYVGLRLDEHWTHPDNRGWVELFSMWARSRTFSNAWTTHRRLFGTRFGYFCQQRLGLT